MTQQRRGGGFTLLETSLAITVIALILIGLLSLLPAFSRGQSQLDHRLRAARWAQSLLEQLKSQPVTALVSGPLGQLDLGDGTVLMADKVCSAQGPNLWQLQITVRWSERGSPRQLQRETRWCPVAR